MLLDFDVDHISQRIELMMNIEMMNIGSEMSLKVYCYSVICMYCFINFC